MLTNVDYIVVAIYIVIAITSYYNGRARSTSIWTAKYDQLYIEYVELDRVHEKMKNELINLKKDYDKMKDVCSALENKIERLTKTTDFLQDALDDSEARNALLRKEIKK